MIIDMDSIPNDHEDCDECGAQVNLDEISEVSGYALCDECYDENVDMCDQCDTETHQSESVYDETNGSVVCNECVTNEVNQ